LRKISRATRKPIWAPFQIKGKGNTVIKPTTGYRTTKQQKKQKQNISEEKVARKEEKKQVYAVTHDSREQKQGKGESVW